MRNVVGTEEAVTRLFNPASVAVIGASSREGALSWWPLHLLATRGYRGEIYPINPTRDRLEGIACLPSIRDVGKPVDVAVIALNSEKTYDAVLECAALGVRNVVLPTQGLGEMGGEGIAKQQRMADIAREAGMRIVGPNSDGVANLANGAIASIQPLYKDAVAAGPVGLVTQSGATSSSLMARLQQHGIGCRMVASGGNEIDLGLADFMSVMVQDPEIRIILSFVEAIRKPEEFLRVADLAHELGKPIVLIKVGRSEEGAARAAAHTGALAGSDQLYDAMFAARGVQRVNELSELVACAKLFLGQGVPDTPGVGIMSVSGGQAGTLADRAATMGVPVPAIRAETEARLTAQLQFGKGFNPCDLTGEIATDPSLALKIYDGFAGEPDIGTVVFARKHLTANASIEAARMLGARTRQPDAAPLAIYAMDGEIRGEEASAYAEAGVPVFDSLNDLFTATDRITAWGRFEGRPDADEAPVADGASFAGVVPDAETKRLLAATGVRMAGEAIAADADAAVVAADAMGYPVVMKVVSDRIPHKTEAGGVVLGVGDADGVRAAFARIMANARAHLGDADADGVLVQEMVTGGTEIILGLKVDPALGPFVVVGLGGIYTELLKDVAIRPAPVDLDTARAMVAELKGAALLTGFRGTAKRDVEALARTIVDVSRFGAAEAGWLAEADLNPVLVLDEGKGVRTVDALLVGREAAA